MQNITKAARLVLPLLFVAGLAYAGVDEWTPLGPDGGRTGRVDIDPSNPNILYTPSPVYKTTNAGQTWELSSNGIPWDSRGHFCGVSLAPNHPNVVYAHG